jgi:serine/threonine protein kinase
MTEPSLPEESIFAQALEITDASERAAFLDRTCAKNQALRAEVEALLRAHERSGDLLDLPDKEPVTTNLPARECPGMVIGPYKLLEQIGEGGMGTVWMAEQTEPLQRRVAVKVVKEGMDSRQVLARFEAERQALALMEHPNIARVLDAGRTQSGRPYFVMELVKGQPITKYCDEKRLGVRERLELFGDVCRAVQHAHQKGIIHRDLKPSNVLVAPYDGKPVVKVIDFGVAKATGQRLTDKTLFTGFGALVGTPEYMSPEQAEVNNQDIDTRSDIYSLGVLLYELLTGSTPLTRQRLKESALLEVLRVIREEEPPRPSTRLSESKDSLPTISAQRQTEPAKLTKLVRGELDWIVMKALEKDRNRRYETANGLATDVQRYLADEPVQACPPSTWYRLRKFGRRNKGKLVVTAALLALLLAGTVVSTWQAMRATFAEKETQDALTKVTEEKAKTEKALAAAREALDTMTDDVVATMFARQPELDESEKAFLRKVLAHYEAVALQIAQSAGARFLRAKGQYKVAHLHELLGDSDGAAGYQKAANLLQELADEFPDKAEYRHNLARTNGRLGILLAEAGQDKEAETSLGQAITLLTKLAEDSRNNTGYRADLANNYLSLGYLLQRRQDYVESGKAYGEAVDRLEKLVAERGDVAAHHQDLARARMDMGQLLREQAKLESADKLYEQAISVQEQQLQKFPDVPARRRQLADSYHGRGIVYAEQKRMGEAEKTFARALDLREKLTADFPKVVVYRKELARNYSALGYLSALQKKFDAAEKAYHKALAVQEKLAAERGSVAGYREDLALTYGHLATLHQQRNQFAQAVPLLEKGRAQLQAALSANAGAPIARRFLRETQRSLATCYLELGDHARLAATADDLARLGFAPADDTYDAAGMLSSCAILAGKDTGLSAAKSKELARSYSERALTLLRQAVERGFKDAARMKKDPHFEPLRERSEFRKLLGELEAK